MRRTYVGLLAIGVMAAGAILFAASGCRTSTQSGLPNHIRTVEVHIFQNKTMYKDIETWVTRGIIDRINADPTIRVSSRNGDALITGEILAVDRTTLRETTSNQPGTVQITVLAEYSFYDNVQRRYIVENVPIRSSETGISPGIYEASRGGTRDEGERGAADQLAAEIVRRTIGMW